MADGLIARWLTPQEVNAYEREHGVKPPGYRGTGRVEWFKPRHPESAPCLRCGTVTDRWIVDYTVAQRDETAGKTRHVDQPLEPLAAIPDATDERPIHLCFGYAPFCQRCEDRNSIQVLELRQQNPTLLPSLRETELQYLTELKLAIAD